MGNVKEKNRVINTDVIKYIAKNSSLTRSQVKEVFEVYKDMLEQLMTSKYRGNDFVISMPYIGTFYFQEKKGRPKGSTYKLPASQGSRETKTITLEHSEPSFDLIKFKPLTSLSDKLKEATTHYE